MTDAIQQIDETLESCARRGCPAVVLFLSETDRAAVERRKKESSSFAEACDLPTVDDARPRYFKVPMDRSPSDFSFVVVRQRGSEGLQYRRIQIGVHQITY